MEQEIQPKPPSATERVYRNEQIAIIWNPRLCIHSQNCVNGLPQVFQRDQRPWIKVNGATASEIAEVVTRCPSGALRFQRLDGGEQEQAPEQTIISPQPDGPLYVRGQFRVVASDGTVIREATRVALCRCGQSSNKPFCDGTHETIGFKA